MDESIIALKKQIREWIKLDFIVPEDIPDIELYMDQVTTFMDNHLAYNKRNDEDRILTKMMINNYTKNKLLPPPNKKRYSKEHIIILIYIYYLKNVISISDIQMLLEPMIDRYYEGPDKESDKKLSAKKSAEKKSLYEIYEFIFELEKAQYFNTEASVIKSAAMTEKKFPESEDEYLNKMALIYLLSYDIYTKKRFIEKLIDEINEDIIKADDKQGKKSDSKSAKKVEAKKTEAKKVEVRTAKKSETKKAETKTEKDN